MMEAGLNKTLEFLAGGGEMGERIRHFDWQQNTLGDPQHWPQSLKTCVRIMLSSKQPIWIGWGHGLIKLYNDAYIDIVRGKHPVALGQPASVVWKDIWKDIEPLLTRAMDRDEGTYVESQLLIMERSGFPEETYYTFSYTPVLGDDGRPAGIICYNTADTARIINERSLKTMQQLDTLGQKKTEEDVYRQAAKALSVNTRDFPFAIIYKITDDGQKAKMVATTGITEDHPGLSQTIDLQVPGEEADTISTAVSENRIVESGSDGRWQQLPQGAWDVAPRNFLDVPIKSANKKYPLAVLTVALNPYRKFDDAYRNFIQLIADQISLGVNNALAYEEERMRAKALEELDKAKTLFFTNISHEFRTPLMLILGPLEELLNKTGINLSLLEKQNLEVTHRNALRLLKLVNTLLDFSRIESGRNEARFVSTEISAFTKNLASNFRSVIEKADLQLKLNVEQISEPVYVDRQMWEKIVFNLLSNAFKYTLEGTITLTLTSQNGQLVLSVEDTGVGIPQKELPRMFDRFHRVQNTAGRTYEGTGIGLSLIKELVLLHQGTIEVQSMEGKGSIFTVAIPFGKEHLPSAQVHTDQTDFEDIISNVFVEEASTLLEIGNDDLDQNNHFLVSDGAGRELVLVVDDNADMRQHIKSLLGTKYDIITASNGLDALPKIAAYKPSLILSDIMMPEMDGIELLRHVKEGEETARIPVILITARAGEESKIEGYEIGADDYLVKPFSTNELLARIKAQIRIAKARKQVEQRLQGFLMQMPAAVSVVEGPTYRFTLVNSMFQKLAGKTSAELIGSTIEQSFPELSGQELMQMYDEVYRSGKPVTRYELPISWRYENKIRTGYFDMVIYPIKDEKEELTELLLHAVESTGQVLARKNIEESEKKFRTLTETLPQLVWMTDENGVQLFASRRWTEYTGIVPTDEDSWMKIVYESDIQNIVLAWGKSLKTGETYRVEVRLKNKKGEYRWHSGRGEPIRNEAGDIINWIGAFTDIHDQRIFTDQLERKVEQRTEDLVKANKELESFNYIASHDLQEPLRKIQTFINLIEKNSNDTEAVQRYYHKIYASAQRMSDLIQSVLSYSRLAKTGEEYTDTDLNKILNDIKIDFELLLAEKDATITSDDLPVIRANGFQINQLFSNLISNSLKFSKNKPHIHIAAELTTARDITVSNAVDPSERFVRLTFSDNGIGFEQEFSEKIFSLFQRLHGKHEYSGTGIGLSIVKKIVEQHDGFIVAESKPGEGAVFNIWLPVLE
ncbi:MAG: ATP-binding protein [Dyadobacter sp.]|uniref:ATP-binding protein n=1 Tax=Dyadobacter sp. TaxID=1914288 RepID=UPI0032672D5E